MLVRPAPTWPALVLFLGLVPAIAAEQSQKLPSSVTTEIDAAPITLELIMSDPEWIGHQPLAPYWADDSRAVYFEQQRSGEELRSLIRVDPATGEQAIVADKDRGIVDVGLGRLSPDRTSKVYSRHGDIYLKDLATGAVAQLTRTRVPETEPHFTADGHGVMFERDGAFFVRDLSSGLESQAADVRLEEDPAEAEELDDFLSEQQLRLFDVLRQRKERSEAAHEAEKQEQAADATRPPEPFYLGKDLEIRQRALSPAGDALLLVVAETGEVDRGRRDQMPAWITESGYVDLEEVRPKVGTGNGAGERLIYLDLATHTRHEIDLAVLPQIAEDPLAELRAAAEQARTERLEPEHNELGTEADATTDDSEASTEEDADPSAETDPRPVIFESPVTWSPDGRQLVVQAHSRDNKDRWLALVDRHTKTLLPIHRLTQDGWINWWFNEFGWLADSRRLYFLSEETGYSQLYLYSVDNGQTRRLTDGDYVVSDVIPGPDERYFYFTANPQHPGIYDTYRVEIEGGRIEQLTDLGGWSSSLPSPDGRSILITHSTTTRPPELYIQEARPGARAHQLTHTATEHFRSLPWVQPEIVALPSSHQSRPVYARFYPPAGEPRDGGPAVVFVHGAGYLQNAHHGWSRYFREFMFHTFLAQHGYAVLDVDYRGSAGYGTAWRNSVYRQAGSPELEDLRDSVAWLAAEHGVDRQRIGLYGGSYGGFLTMMALFKEPDLFACGAALRPVTDWAHYNHSYTSNLLNTPDVDPEAYRRSSPIEFAGGLEKPLLICAPMQDNNVLFLDTVRLAQRLIELEKENWEVAIFPVEPHSFREPSSWLNEYRRIFKLFERHLKP